MRRIPPLLAVIALLCTLAGCTGAPVVSTSPPPTPTPTTDESGAPDDSSPIDLVGLWRVSGAEGEGDDTWLRLGGGDVVLWRPCGMLLGVWAADGPFFLAGIDGASQECAPPGTDWTHVPWLLAATGYHRAGDGWELIDGDGEVVAILTPDGAPRPIDTADPSLAQPPVVEGGAREALAAPEPLPDGLTPADALSMIGGWVPADDSFETDPGVTFLADGTFRASDGCNGLLSRWAVPGPGRLLALVGGTTDIGCDGAPVPWWVAGAARAGFDGDELVLIDRLGDELGRLVRA